MSPTQQTTSSQIPSSITPKRQKCEVYSRISGYLRPIDSWNKGKQEEFSDRKYYKITA